MSAFEQFIGAYFGCFRYLYGLFSSFFQSFIALAHQKGGIAIHIIGEVAETVVLAGSFESGTSAKVGSHLRHSSKDMLDSCAYFAGQMITSFLLFGQGGDCDNCTGG